jgi:hypothetical protein
VNPFGSDEARGVEQHARPAAIALDHRPALDVDVVLARFAVQALGVLVRNLHREHFVEFFHARIDRRRVRELGKHDEPHRQERAAAADGSVDHRQHAIGVGAHIGACRRVRQVRLARRDGVSDVRHRSP